MSRKLVPMRSDASTRENETPQPQTPRHAVRRSSTALTILAVVASAAALHYARLVWIVICISMLIAFAVEPLVNRLTKLRVPRSVAALIVLLVCAAALYGLSYVSYNRAVAFSNELPKYSAEIRQYLAKYGSKAQSIANSARTAISPNQQPTPVSPQPSGIIDKIESGLGTATEVIFGISFIPFLIFFMLTWRDHAYAATVLLFAPESRDSVRVTLGKIANLFRAFVVGNLLIGLFIGAVSTTVFGILGIPYFYFIGFISGFLSLVPYLGVPLAFIPPTLAGMGKLHSGGILVIGLTILGLHLLSLNVLYPKFLGTRLRLNPLAVTVALLFWGWIWGAMGLILAIPITAAMKVVFDHVETLNGLGSWLGE